MAAQATDKLVAERQGIGGSITVQDILDLVPLENSALIFRGITANVDSTIYEDDFVIIKWDSTNQQPTYNAKAGTPLGTWLWQDAGVTITLGNSAGSPSYTNDDISSASGIDRYFTTGGALDAAFNHGNWGSHGQYRLIKETFVDGWPSYYFTITRGNSGKLDFQLILGNQQSTNYKDYA